MEGSFPAALDSDALTGDETVRAAWMEDSETRAVVAALEAKGHAIRFVGGCVRDTLLGRPIADIDIATDLEPARLLTIFPNAIETGVSKPIDSR